MKLSAACLLSSATLCLYAPLGEAGHWHGCRTTPAPGMSFIEFQSYDPATQQPLAVKGTFRMPDFTHGRRRCGEQHDLPAVVILHSSAGVDATGTFYAEALNAAGVATLEIDMWEARGVVNPADRPAAPVLTYPDAFAALAYLAAQPDIDASRIGVLGFSWGGVVSLAASEQTYASMFGGGLQFKAHVANYPICYAANNAAMTPDIVSGGALYQNLTGAPVLIQVGSEDDYDNGAAACKALAATVNAQNGNVVQVVEYPGAAHAWDRLMVPISPYDPFGDQGSYFMTGVVPKVDLVPDVTQALASRKRVVRFFQRNL